jgi:hypothetical protein
VDDANVDHIAVLGENVAHLVLVGVQRDVADKHLMIVRVPGSAAASRASQGATPVISNLVVPISFSFSAHALPLVIARRSSAFTPVVTSVVSAISTVITPVITTVVPKGLEAGTTTLLLHALARRETTLLLASGLR